MFGIQRVLVRSCLEIGNTSLIKLSIKHPDHLMESLTVLR